MVTSDPRVTYNKGVTWSLLRRIVEMTPMKVFLKGSESNPKIEIALPDLHQSRHQRTPLSHAKSAPQV